MQNSDTQNMLEALLNNEEYEDACQLLLQRLPAVESSRGKYHPDSIQALNRISKTYLLCGNTIQALEYSLEARDRIRYALTDEHPLMVTTLIIVADIYLVQKLFRESSLFLSQALTLAKSLHGESSEELISLYTQLGELYEAQNSAREACLHYEEAAELYQNFEHLDSLEGAELFYRIATLYAQQNHHLEAARFLERVINVLPANQDPKNSLLLRTRALLGQMHFELHDWEQAEESLTMALRIHEQYPELEGTDPIELLNTIDRLYNALGRVDKAEDRFKSCLNILEARHGQDSIEVADATRHLGEFYYLHSQYSKAKSCLHRSCTLYTELEGEHSPRLPNVLHNLGTVCVAEDTYEEACLYFEQSLALRKSLKGESHPETALSQFALGSVLKIMGKFDEAKEHLQTCLQIRQDKYGYDHELTSQVQRSIAELDEPVSPISRKETEIHLEEGAQLPPIDSTRPDSGVYILSNVATDYGMALHHLENRNYRDAIPMLNRILQILETEHGENHRDLIPVLESLAQANAALGRDDEAQLHASRAQSIQEL